MTSLPVGAASNSAWSPTLGSVRPMAVLPASAPPPPRDAAPPVDAATIANRRASGAGASTSVSTSHLQQRSSHDLAPSSSSNSSSRSRTSAARRQLRDWADWTAPKVDDQAWTSMIVGCSSPSELQRCLSGMRSLNKFHLTAALNKLASFTRGPRAVSHSQQGLELLQSLLPRVREALPHLQARSLSAISHCLGTYELKDKELMAELAKQAEQHSFADFTPQGLSNLLWGFSRVNMQPSQRWMDSFLGACQTKLSAFKAQELSLVLWCLAKLRFRLAPTRVKDLLQHVTAHLPSYSPQSLSNVLWALGVSDHRPDDAWLAAVMAEMTVPAKLEGFTNQGLSQALWALAVLQIQPSQPFKSSAAAAIAARLPNCHRHIDLATYMYACAGLQLPVSSTLAMRLEENTRQHMASMQPRHMACIVWAFAHLDIQPSVPWLRRLFSMAYQLLGTFGVRDLAMLSWGLARLNILPPYAFLQPFVNRIEQLAAEFQEPQEVANTVWALACYGIRPSSLLIAQFFEATDRRMSTFKPLELSQMIWALAERNCVLERQWVQEFLKVSFLRLPDFSAQGLANVIWALDRLHVAPPPAWLYSYVKAAQALRVSGGLAAVDLGTIINALNSLNRERQLQKVTDFVNDAMSALSTMESDSQAYTRQQVQYMLGLRWSPAQAQVATAGGATAMGSLDKSQGQQKQRPASAAAAEQSRGPGAWEQMGIVDRPQEHQQDLHGQGQRAGHAALSDVQGGHAQRQRHQQVLEAEQQAAGHSSMPLDTAPHDAFAVAAASVAAVVAGKEPTGPSPPLASASAAGGAGTLASNCSAAAVPEMDVHALRLYLEAQVQADVLRSYSQPAHSHSHGRDASMQRKLKELVGVGAASHGVGGAAASSTAQLGKVLKRARQRQRQHQLLEQPLSMQVQPLSMQVPAEVQIGMPDLRVELLSHATGARAAVTVQTSGSSSSSLGGNSNGSGCHGTGSSASSNSSLVTTAGAVVTQEHH